MFSVYNVALCLSRSPCVELQGSVQQIKQKIVMVFWYPRFIFSCQHTVVTSNHPHVFNRVGKQSKQFARVKFDSDALRVHTKGTIYRRSGIYVQYIRYLCMKNESDVALHDVPLKRVNGAVV